jgi:hypothetical protein
MEAKILLKLSFLVNEAKLLFHQLTGIAKLKMWQILAGFANVK